jgi:protoporphyrinogen/coproporphyrinogen III oxidase
MKAMRSVAVIGGGIAGLAAAHRVRELAAERDVPIDVTVIERSERTGGCVETRYDDGFVMELGSDSLLIEKPSGIGLVRRLGLEHVIIPIRPEYRGARVVRAGRLVPIPDDFRFFTPTSLLSLVTSRLFSPAGVARAAMEPFVKPNRTDEDESLAAFVTRRFGREVLDRLAQPLIGGVYSGDPERLSMRATMPQFVELERRYGSLVRAMRATKAPNGATRAAPSRLVGLRSGFGEMIRALERRLAGVIRTSSQAAALERTNGSWSVALANGKRIGADTVICAVPAYESARLFAPLSATLGELLARITYHSVATITLAYETDALPRLPRCTGFVVPHVEGRSIMAATFTTQKYEHRAPAGSTLIRCFAGGALAPQLAVAPEADLVAMSRAELRDLVGIAAEPRFTLVRRWLRATPEYAIGHTALVERIEREVAAIGGCVLAGSAYRGAGIPDCIRSGEQAAEAVFTLGSAAVAP